MYCISEQQIDFILDDISARGVRLVSLQQDLLDHVCCLIEQNLDEGGDFEGYYQSVISRFYEKELIEIETETINLLTHKNYYVMKKIMLGSGSFSAVILSLGIVFKFMHWPGASLFILLGIVLLGLVFLPLLFVLKAREKRQSKDKIIVALGALAAISLSMGVLFKIMHWPFANILCISAMAIMLVLFLPIYFFSGIRSAETKVNTLVSSIIIVVGCALVLTLVRSPYGTQKVYADKTQSYFINERILDQEIRLANMDAGSLSADFKNSSDKLFAACQQIKESLLKSKTGVTKLTADYAQFNQLLDDADAGLSTQQITDLRRHIEVYNSKVGDSCQRVLTDNSLLDEKDKPIAMALNDLVQIQMIVLQNQRIKF